MGQIASLRGDLTVRDTNGAVVLAYPFDLYFSANTVVKREQVSLSASSFTALSPPTGARYVLIDPDSAASLTLKGVTGDTGITMVPATLPIKTPIMLSLGATPSFGILNSDSLSVITVIWLG